MRTKVLSILVCVMFLVMMVPGIASAEEEATAPYTDAQFAVLEKMVSQANHRIEVAVKVAQNTPFDDVAQLLVFVDQITACVFNYADSIGATVVCEYTTYYIDGQYVLIDPLRIIPL